VTVFTPEQVYPLAAGAMPVGLIDVRSPGEIAAGALPYAQAQPILHDDERHHVGIRYAHAGQEAAIRLGYELTRDALEGRIAALRSAAGDAPTAVACWRGGLRSALAVQHAALPHVKAVAGGYKALRSHLRTALEARLRGARTIVLAGLTGSGKTDVLHALAHPGVLALDLEGHAQHRGSAFGAYATAQPTQATFENAVAADVVLSPAPLIVVEDESRFVGARSVPEALWRTMRAAEVIWLDAPLAERSARVFDAYVAAPNRRDGVAVTHARLDAALARLERRYGGDRVARARAQLAAARGEASFAAHRTWIEPLLVDYYDRLYTHAFDALGRSVLHRGDAASLLTFVHGVAQRAMMER
jgi:tRNA 2-selenouridine synthase